MEYTLLLNKFILLYVSLILQPVTSSSKFYVGHADTAFRKVSDIGGGLSDIRVRGSDKEEQWVVDAIQYDDGYQGDDPKTGTEYDLCPPVPEVVTDEACNGNKCQSDSDCTESFRCCYNGCSFVCLMEVEPAAVLDWMKEPRRSRSGISWLVYGPRIKSVDSIPCTTSPVDQDEDPLLCPHGFFCHVEDPGNPEQEIPNKGYCVKETDDLFVSAENENAAFSRQKSCYVGNYVLLDGAKMRFKDRICRCKRGFLSCSKRKRKERPEVTVKAKVNRKKKSRKHKKSKNKSG